MANSNQAASTEDELVLLERVFLRVGSADTDDQLESVLCRFLTPVLLKLASQTDGVRKKVMELLVHLNKRLKSRPLVQLPVEDLLDQYANKEVSPFVTNFTILYVKMGYPRLVGEKQGELMPQLLTCIHSKPQTQKDSLLQIVVRSLQFLKFTLNSISERKAVLQLDKVDPETVNHLLKYMLDVLLLPYGAPPTPQGQEGPSSPVIPAGLSEMTYKKACGDPPLTAEQIEKVKLSVVETLSAGVLPDAKVIPLLVVGLGDGRGSVVSGADRELKRLAGGQDWNNMDIILKLFSVFQGSINIKGQPPVKPQEKRMPAGINLRLKIFPYFLKSRESCNCFPASVQVPFDCWFGTNTNSKLKSMAVQFVHHMTQFCTEAKFAPIAAILMSGLTKLINEATADPKLRAAAYVAAGMVVSRSPRLLNRDISVPQTFFEAITKEQGENRMAVQEALALMAPALRNIDAKNMQILEAMIMQNIEKQEPAARMVAVQYAQTVFASDHIPSRYILLLAAGDLKEEVYSEASKALHGSPEEHVDGEKKVKKLPDFTAMMSYIQEKGVERLKTAKKYVMGNNVLPFNPASYGEMLVYLRACLAATAGVVPRLESVQSMKDQAPAIHIYLAGIIDDKNIAKTPVGMYISMMRQLLTAIGGAPAMYCLLEIVAVARQQLAPEFIKHVNWIKGFVYNSKEEMREYSAELYGLVVAEAGGVDKQIEIITQLTDAIKTQALEGQHGSVLALGHLIGRVNKNQGNKLGDVAVEDMDTEQTENPKCVEVVDKAVRAIITLLDSSQNLLVTGACSALAEIGRNSTLPLPDTAEGKDKVSKMTIVEKLVKKVSTTKENNKVRESAAVCLGSLCVGEKEFPHKKKIIESLLECAEAKQVELHFTVGDSLVTAALGSASPSARDAWLVAEEDHVTTAEDSNDVIKHLLDLLLKKQVVSANPHIRQAACIWLLSLSRNCRKHTFIQTNFPRIQQAFMSLLADSDDLTQDIASKGLGVVYENCGKEQKDQLVSVLIDTLTTGTKRKTEVTGDTQVFQEGQLGKTPDGKNMSTYRELCSIANDLNQPDLIYKFMHLANHNAIWNSRKGAAFGFTSIAAQAGEQLAPHLGKILPKLYRYQFDPNPQINAAMTSIWSALVTDPKKTVDKYLREIFTDLLGNLTNNQWRIRESSCLAINDLLRGRTLDVVTDLLPELWETLLRVRDDIKESVRKAADIAVKTLSRTSIKLSDTTYGKSAEKVTAAVLPALLGPGLSSPVAEVRAIALSTLLKMAKNAGALLKPHIATLIPALLEALSTLEHEGLSYLSNRVSTSAQSQERLDHARIAATKTSPMMDTIKLAVQYIDADVMVALSPRLNEMLRGSVGMATKAGCANLLCTLTHQCAYALEPYAGKILGTLFNGLSDRNANIRRHYATAIGHMIKVAKSSSVEKLIEKLKAWYLEKEDETVHEVCGIALLAMNNHSPDVLKEHFALALPLAFLAMHRKQPETEENQEEKSNVWEELWLDTTPGTETGVRLYLTELTELTQTALQSQSWASKATAAAAMNTIATKLQSNLGPPQLGLLLRALTEGLQGRTWTGKEALLQAIKAVCVSCKEAVLQPDDAQPSLDTVLEAVIKECRKEKVSYKMSALQCIGPILETHKIDRYSEIHAILDPMLIRTEGEELKKDKYDVTRDMWLEFEATAYECIGEAWPTNKQTQVEHEETLLNRFCSELPRSVWKIQLNILKCLNKLLTRTHLLRDKSNMVESESEQVDKLVSVIVPPVSDCLCNVKYSSVRGESLKLLTLLYDKLTTAGRQDALGDKQVDSMQPALVKLADDSSAPDLQHKARTLLNSIKK